MALKVGPTPKRDDVRKEKYPTSPKLVTWLLDPVREAHQQRVLGKRRAKNKVAKRSRKRNRG